MITPRYEVIVRRWIDKLARHRRGKPSRRSSVIRKWPVESPGGGTDHPGCQCSGVSASGPKQSVRSRSNAGGVATLPRLISYAAATLETGGKRCSSRPIGSVGIGRGDVPARQARRGGDMTGTATIPVENIHTVNLSIPRKSVCASRPKRTCRFVAPDPSDRQPNQPDVNRIGRI